MHRVSQPCLQSCVFLFLCGERRENKIWKVVCTGTTCTNVTARSVVLREVYMIFQSKCISGEPGKTLNMDTALTRIGFTSTA